MTLCTITHSPHVKKDLSIRNLPLASAWIATGIIIFFVLSLFNVRFFDYIAGVMFILCAQQAIMTYHGVVFDKNNLTIPTPIISWFPFVVFGYTRIQKNEFINVMALGNILGQEIIGFPTFSNDFCIAVPDRDKRIVFCDAIEAKSAETEIYRRDR